ncbi:pyridoxamine 5'-phosphate oxidase family protein [Pseudooceanicola sp. CBS1P-1]|uniref:General stress protein n=1 Tax=Pseudooceanicola albus TaxID=2692189 RepID=A0A6L7G2Z1_9RHOB|nr:MULTISPECIES: pyridoxamine 5'-phosphate oxidase family protein [Pseudooceanicola]MBT9384933.1 pyridoxamine 5'-phosphate oxidase family protein [Pseudooceanicola endophyticus]MXN18072.1 general stress protein [Pseudooceanicola albus]
MKDLSNNTAQDLWTRLDKATAGMLQTGPEQFDPMAPFADAEEGMVWFITAMGTQAHQAAIEKRDSRFLVCDQHARLHAHLEGSLHEVFRPAKLDALWSPVTEAWFEQGRADPAVRLLCFRPTRAEVWLTEGGASFLYQIARARHSSRTPDIGHHEVLTF